MPSAQMKIFIDRISTLLFYNTDLLKAFEGKKVLLITSYGSHPYGRNGFENIFTNITKYLKMQYIASYFHYSGKNQNISQVNQPNLTTFLSSLRIALKTK